MTPPISPDVGGQRLAPPRQAWDRCADFLRPRSNVMKCSIPQNSAQVFPSNRSENIRCLNDYSETVNMNIGKTQSEFSFMSFFNALHATGRSRISYPRSDPS